MNIVYFLQQQNTVAVFFRYIEDPMSCMGHLLNFDEPYLESK